MAKSETTEIGSEVKAFMAEEQKRARERERRWYEEKEAVINLQKSARNETAKTATAPVRRINPST